MRCFRAVVLLCCLLFSCTRGKDVVDVPQGESRPKPLAVLQAGKYPLWFQFTDDGPVLIDTIEDACFSAAFIPWPLARHISFILARDDEIMMTVNRGGFMCLTPWQGGKQENSGIGLYYISGGDYWQRYTTNAFFMIGEERKPLAFLYRDNRFIDSDQSDDSPLYFWTFDLQTALPYKTPLTLLDAFPLEERWVMESFRYGPDGFVYFRVYRQTEKPEIRMYKADSFSSPAEQISLGAFQNSAKPEPVSAAPEILGEMLGLVFSESGYKGAANVVSPEFQYARSFASDTDSSAITGFYSGNFFLAITPNGEAFYIETGTALERAASGRAMSVRRFSLPGLPEGFVYTGVSMIADAVFASWEEQEGYSIGAAGFMALKFDSSIAQ
jgi:hypothetical protein